MGLRNTETGWGSVTRIIHWVMAFLILAMLIFGTIMSETTDLVEKFQMVQNHKSAGFLVFTLAVLRVIWRAVSPETPALPKRMPGWQVLASKLSHVALYVLILAIPLSGWLMVTSSPLNDPGAYPVQVPNMVFGLFAMPDPYPTGDAAISETFHTVHMILTKLLMAILALHVLAALKHHMIDRDTVLRRMIRG